MGVESESSVLSSAILHCKAPETPPVLWINEIKDRPKFLGAVLNRGSGQGQPTPRLNPTGAHLACRLLLLTRAIANNNLGRYGIPVFEPLDFVAYHQIPVEFPDFPRPLVDHVIIHHHNVGIRKSLRIRDPHREWADQPLLAFSGEVLLEAGLRDDQHAIDFRDGIDHADRLRRFSEAHVISYQAPTRASRLEAPERIFHARPLERIERQPLGHGDRYVGVGRPAQFQILRPPLGHRLG